MSSPSAQHSSHHEAEPPDEEDGKGSQEAIAVIRIHKKPFRVFASTGMLLCRRFIDPVSLAIVMSMQADLIIPSWQRLLRVFR